MASTHTYSSRRRTLFLVIIIVVTIVMAGIWYWNANKKSIIKHEVTNAANKKTNGLYTIRYGEISLDEVNGNLSVANIQIEYDSLKVDSLLKINSAAPVLFHIQADSLIATGIKTPKALLDKEIVGSSVKLVNPTIQLIYTGQERNAVKYETHKELYEQILGNLKLIKIDTINIVHGLLTTRKISKQKNDMNVSSFSISLNHVLVDSASAKDTARLFFAEQSIIQCKQINWQGSSKDYHYTIKQLAMKTLAKEVTIDTFLLTPFETEEGFMKQLDVQQDRYNFNIHHIKIDGLNFYQLFSNNQFLASNITLSKSSFKIYRDLTMPHDSSNKVGKYPQQALMKIKLPLYVPSISLKDCFVEYKEKNKKTELDGKVQFFNVNATLKNVTNMKQKIQQHDLLTININTDFLNKIPFSVKWVMYLKDKAGKFTLNGSIGAFDGTQVNEVTEPMGPAKVESGNIKEVKFDFVGSDHKMDGHLFMLYDNLKVSLLDAKDEQLKKKGLQTVLANIFIKNANPMKGKDTRISTVHYERDRTRSVFSLIWKSIFTGVKDNIGLKK